MQNGQQGTIDVESMFKQWRDLSLNNWAVMSQQMVESEPFTQMMQATSDVVLASQKQLRTNVDTFLTSLDLPTKNDLARLSKQVLAAEQRALACEDKIDALHAEIASLKQLLVKQAAVAPVQAAEPKAAFVKVAEPRPAVAKAPAAKAAAPKARPARAAAPKSVAAKAEPAPAAPATEAASAAPQA